MKEGEGCIFLVVNTKWLTMVLCSGEGANKFAAAHNIQQVDPDALITPLARKKLALYKTYNKTVYNLFNKTE